MRRIAPVVVGIICGVGLVAAAVPTRAAVTLPNEQSSLPAPAGLRPQIEFWKKIFGVYSTNQVVIHDAWHLDWVYEVLDFRPLADSGASDAEVEDYIHSKVREEKERVRAMLMRLHQVGPDSSGLSDEERKIWAMMAGVKEPSKFLEAADEDRVRGQRGLRERFAAGVEVSRRYLPEMETIFRREGLPVSLTRLPLVESCFNVRAYSKVGAAGIWQFMPSTGRLYMRVDNAVDERRDPIRSTEAAAEHLKRNYDVLGTWPLAITAYNHGRAGIARAIDSVGSTDIVQIIQHYQGPAFKFASRNFYAEFIAALEVEQHFQDYFGPLSAHPPLRADTVVVPDYVTFKGLAQAAKADEDTLADLNPALTREVIDGRLRVPKGYQARVPVGASAGFAVRYASLPAAAKGQVRVAKAPGTKSHAAKGRRGSAQSARYVTHRVQRGQTLEGIAKRYRTTVAAIQRRNNLRGNGVRAGQSLVIPTT